MTKSSRPAAETRGDDAAVEAEWRRIEAERVAQEQEEARDEVPEATGATRARSWPWLALVASLVAGVLVALAVNWFSLRPTDGVAVGTDAGPAPAPEPPPAAGARGP